MFHSTKRSITSTDGEGGSSPITLRSLVSFAKLPSPTDGPKLSRAAAGSAGCGQGATDTTGQSEGNASSLCPGGPGSLPSVLSCKWLLWVLHRSLHGLGTQPATRSLQTNKLLTDNKLPSMPLLAGTGNPENHGRNHFTEKPSCFKRADPDRGTVS